MTTQHEKIDLEFNKNEDVQKQLCFALKQRLATQRRRRKEN
jgi:hypothetical protein